MNKKYMTGVALGVGVILVVGGWAAAASRAPVRGAMLVSPSIGTIENYISATATVQPQNRLEINPPIAGRVEQVLVVEGQKVKSGDTLALMSSSDRAALLDAARLQGPETLNKWEDVYKMTPLLAPIDGEVIVQKIRPGKNVTSADAVVVLSDRLIVQAQVDETDIGKVRAGQAVRIGLDAYPKIDVGGKVDHVYYESTVVSNVITYFVDIVPDEVPEVFRSGMSAAVRILQERVENALLVPRTAVRQDKDRAYVLVDEKGKVLERPVTTGLSDEERIEIKSGISMDARIVLAGDHFDASVKKKASTNPFMPTPPRGARSGRH